MRGGPQPGVEKLGGEFERHKHDSDLSNWSTHHSPSIF